MLYHNMTLSELVQEAENTENVLAIAIYVCGFEEYENDEGDGSDNTDFPVMTDAYKYSVVNDILNAEWSEKQVTKGKERYWILMGFHEDTNLYHNHIEVYSDITGRNYVVNIRYEALGETTYTANIKGLAHAKKHAIDKAIELAIHGKLSC